MRNKKEFSIKDDVQVLASYFKIAAQRCEKRDAREKESERLLWLLREKVIPDYESFLEPVSFPVALNPEETMFLKCAFAEAAETVQRNTYEAHRKSNTVIINSMSKPAVMAQNIWDEAVKQNIIRPRPLDLL